MTGDRWARWVLGLQQQGRTAPLNTFRDGVLDRAQLTDGDVLLDIGCGAGLIGFGALERMGTNGQVIFSDISDDLLNACRERATTEGLLDRCRFIRASADNLDGIEDGSVDVVTTRSVLIYLKDKHKAFTEFHRALKPGGRLSIFEPINRFVDERKGRYGMFGMETTAVAELAAKVGAVYTSGPADQDPMRDFDERDLLRQAEAAGFTALTLDYRAVIDVPTPPLTTDWDAMKRTAPNPLAPTYEEAMAQALTEEERERFENHVRTEMAKGTPTRTTMATAFLSAVRQ